MNKKEINIENLSVNFCLEFGTGSQDFINKLAYLLSAIRADEREKCAKIVEYELCTNKTIPYYKDVIKTIKAIRDKNG